MFSASMFFIMSILVLIFPSGNNHKYPVKSEKDQKNNSSINVNLSLGSSTGTHKIHSDVIPIEKKSDGMKTLELPPETFAENALQMESWMMEPENWNNN